MVVTGNPVREDIIELGDKAYPEIGVERIFRILVIGGSQGASIFGEVVPQAISTLPRALQRRLQITQQCRAEDIEKVREKYIDTKIAVELSTFIPNIPDCLEWAHLVIGRAGASTIAELTASGRAGILVPYPQATDNHQTENARELVLNGGAWIFNQKEFNAAELAKLLQRLAKRPRDVWRASEDARKIGKPYATKDLANLVERLALVKGNSLSIQTEKVKPTPDFAKEKSEDPTENARELVLNGGAWIFNQKEFNAAELAKLLQRLAKRPRDVWRASEDARKIGKPYATKDLANLVERLALVKGNSLSIQTEKVKPTPDFAKEKSEDPKPNDPKPKDPKPKDPKVDSNLDIPHFLQGKQ